MMPRKTTSLSSKGKCTEFCRFRPKSPRSVRIFEEGGGGENADDDVDVVVDDCEVWAWGALFVCICMYMAEYRRLHVSTGV